MVCTASDGITPCAGQWSPPLRRDGTGAVQTVHGLDHHPNVAHPHPTELKEAAVVTPRGESHAGACEVFTCKARPALRPHSSVLMYTTRMHTVSKAPVDNSETI
jgi:hypothetical protein